jgi:5,10-methylenetetrahydromethanopterin reductase
MSEIPLGAVFPAAADAAELPGFAARVEELGFDQLWVIEDCFLSGGLTMAATALAVTRELVVGIGLLPAPVRNPAIAAMEIATLARMHPGRFEVTFGHGVAEWMEQIGALPAKRLSALREVVTVVRALLGGQTVTFDGAHVQLSEVTLERAPEQPPPVLIGTTGPKGLALAGEVADGMLLPEGCGPAFVEWAIPQARATQTHRCVVYAWLSIDEDPGRAADRLVPGVERWLDSGHYPHPQRLAGLAGPPPPPGDPARTKLVPEITVCGDAEACAASVRRFAAAGADTLVLVPPPDQPDAQIEMFAERVMPLVRSR